MGGRGETQSSKEYPCHTSPRWQERRIYSATLRYSIFTVIATVLNDMKESAAASSFIHLPLLHPLPSKFPLSHLYKMSVQRLSRNLGQVQESPSAPVGEGWDQTVNEWQTPSKETREYNLDTYESQSQPSSFKLTTLDSPLSLCNETFI